MITWEFMTFTFASYDLFKLKIKIKIVLKKNLRQICLFVFFFEKLSKFEYLSILFIKKKLWKIFFPGNFSDK